MLLVNYFPGSFGDRVIAKISGLPFTIDSKDRYIIQYPIDLKLTEFYTQSAEDQRYSYLHTVKPFLTNSRVIGVHRNYGFDFKTLDENLTVISIDPIDCLKTVTQHYFNKVFLLGRSHNTMITQILQRYQHNPDIVYRVLEKEIVKWREINILPGDIIFNLQEFIDNNDYAERFKKYIS
jgi:hypothetical protein